MNDQWNKDHAAQCYIDRKKLDDIHTAVCGNAQLGIPGLVVTVEKHAVDIAALQAIKSGGLVLTKAGSVIVAGLIMLAAVGSFILSLITFSHTGH